VIHSQCHRGSGGNGSNGFAPDLKIWIQVGGTLHTGNLIASTAMTQLSLVDESPDLEDLLEHLDHLDDDPNLWPRTLANFLAVSERQIKTSRPELSEDSVRKLARELIASLAHYLGGRQIYFPRDDRLRRALRDHRIYQDFQGHNHDELADRHGLTVIQIYNIVAQQKKLHMARVQPSLPL
jgi:Mor family transcriptional regulator